MKGIFLYFSCFILLTLGACRTDETYKPVESLKPGTIRLALTGRVGAVVGDPLTRYIKSLNLLLFRENENGGYQLFRNLTLTKAQLDALSGAEQEGGAGFTSPKVFTFDTVPLASYKVVGIGNVVDSVGQALPNVTLQGVTVGNDLSQVVASILAGSESPRLFWGITETIPAGGNATALPVLSLYRKVSMFALTLKQIPNVVNKINMDIGDTYGRLAMDGNFVSGSGIPVFAIQPYRQQAGDSITLTYVTLPTITGDSTLFTITFYVEKGPKQVVELPKYVLHPNTITKVTATIDPDQPGERWKVDLTTLIKVDVEWNVDQEPPIII